MNRFLAVTVLAGAVCVSCGRSSAVVIGSKNYTEQLVLGEIAAQQLERKLHLEVDRKLNLGGTLLAHEAILHGDIDIYPEYTGTAASVILKIGVPSDPAQAYIQVKDQYFRRFHLIWLPPLGFNDTFAMVVRSEDARRLSAPDLSAAKERQWRLGVGYEFLTRSDGLEALDKTYALKWQGTPKTMDLGLLYQALEQHGIDMGAANSTDAQLADARFTALRDDKKTFPPYNASFVLRNELVKQKPEIVWALSMLQNHIDEGTMRHLNQLVVAQHQPVAKVARDFLATQP